MLAVAAALALTSATAAAADMTERDLLVLVRALSFVQDMDTDMVRLAVVRDPADARSRAEAAELMSSIGDELDVANVHVFTTEVDIGDLGESPTADVMIVTAGLRPYYQQLADAAAAGRVLSVSSDMSCVQEGFCVLGVQSEPSVRLVLNARTASRNGVAFEPAFRMMVSER